MEIPKIIKDDISEYCKANKISNIDDFVVKMLKQGFTVEKFGATPMSNSNIIEKIVEKIVEVPVNYVDAEINDTMKKLLVDKEELERKLLEMLNENNNLKKQLEQEKLKNKKDIYGEM